jgi:hypothetical protein
VLTGATLQGCMSSASCLNRASSVSHPAITAG